jgi:hypothetical protein
MTLRRPPVALRSHGSGTGPQTPALFESVSCGHCVFASHQGHLLPRATISPALAA